MIEQIGVAIIAAVLGCIAVAVVIVVFTPLLVGAKRFSEWTRKPIFKKKA